MKRVLLLLAGLAIATAGAIARQGDSQMLGNYDWSTASEMTAVDGKLYVAGGTALWEVDKAGKARKLPPPKGWGRTPRLTSLDGKLYAINEERLFEIEPKGAARMLNDDIATAKMTGMAGKLYMIRRQKLIAYGKDGKDEGATDLGGDWYNTVAITPLNGKLYIMSRSQIHEVDEAGQARKIGDPFEQPNAMTSAGGKLYVFAQVATKGGRTFNESAIFEVDPQTGQRTRLPLPKGFDVTDGTSILVALDGKLYMTVDGMSGTKLFSLSIQ